LLTTELFNTPQLLLPAEVNGTVFCFLQGMLVVAQVICSYLLLMVSMHCQSGYDTKTGSRHFFSVLKNTAWLDEWSGQIPHQAMLTIKHKLSDLHFQDQFVIKSNEFVLNSQQASMLKEKWPVTDDTVQCIFPNIPKYLLRL